MSNFWGKNAPKSISAGPTSKGRGGGRGREGEGRGEWRVPPPLKPWLRPCFHVTYFKYIVHIITVLNLILNY